MDINNKQAMSNRVAYISDILEEHLYSIKGAWLFFFYFFYFLFYLGVH